MPEGSAKLGFRIGISGLGSIGSAHARVLAGRRVDLVLSDPDPAALDAVSDLPCADTASSFEQLLDRELDGVVVAAPDRFHVAQAALACERGVPVLLEKPVAEDLAEAKYLVASQARTGTAILVGYVLRHARVLSRAKALIDAGAIGSALSFQVMLGAYETLEVARTRFRDPPIGGLFLDYSHEWDYITWLLGPVQSVCAVSRQAGVLPMVVDPNLADGLLELAGGAIGSFHLDYVQMPGRRLMTVIGDGGTLDVDVPQGIVRVRGRDTAVLHEYREPDARLELLGRQANHFLQVIAGHEVPLVSLEDGLAALRIAVAMQGSSRERVWKAVADP